MLGHLAFTLAAASCGMAPIIESLQTKAATLGRQDDALLLGDHDKFAFGQRALLSYGGSGWAMAACPARVD
jgi:hypothetical protein